MLQICGSTCLAISSDASQSHIQTHCQAAAGMLVSFMLHQVLILYCRLGHDNSTYNSHMGPPAISPGPGVTSGILGSMPSISSRACLYPCSSLAVHMWTEGMCIETPEMGEKRGRRGGSCMHAVSKDVTPRYEILDIGMQ